MSFITYVFYGLKKRLENKLLFVTETVISILLVAALIPISALVFQETSRTARFSIAIVDEEQSFYTQLFINNIISSPSIKGSLDAIVTDRKEAESLMEANEIAGMVVIPAFFTESIRGGGYRPFELQLNRNMPLKAGLIEEGMKSGAYMMSAVQYALYTVYSYIGELPLEPGELDKLFQTEMLILITDTLGRSNIYSREAKTPWLDLPMEEYYLLSLTILFISLFGCEVIFSFYYDEKYNVNKRLLLLQKNYLWIISGNICASSIVLFLQGCVLLLPFLILGRYFNLIPSVLLIALLTSIFNMLLANLFENPRVASMVSIIITVLQAFFAGLLVPLNLLPSVPGAAKFFTTHFWQQQSLILNYTSKTAVFINEGMAAVSFIICALFLLLGGVIYVKYRNYRRHRCQSQL